jgi:hypothetical protein
MASNLAQKLAKAVADDLFARMGRSESERLGSMLGVMMMDPGLRNFQADLVNVFDRVIRAAEEKASTKRRRRTRPAPKKSKTARKTVEETRGRA